MCGIRENAGEKERERDNNSKLYCLLSTTFFFRSFFSEHPPEVDEPFVMEIET